MRKLGLLFLSLCLSSTVSAQEKFTLALAQEYALDHAYGVQIAKLEIERAKQIYRQNLAYGLPRRHRPVDNTSTMSSLVHW